MLRIASIDQGTTSTRAYVMTSVAAGEIVYAKSHTQIYPQPSWVEHHPLQLLNNIREAIVTIGEVDALALTNQGESCLAWDSKTGEPICNIIVWQDRRNSALIKKLKTSGCETITRAKAGLPLDSYFSAAKFHWILNNIPQAKKLLAQGRLHLGTSDAFFIERLTGNFYTDISTASRTSLLNLNTEQWDEELCDLFGVPIAILPEIKPNDGGFGVININKRSIPLMVAIVDQQASLYGHGARKSGDTKVTFGTGAFALALKTQKPKNTQGLIATIAWKTGSNKTIYALDGGIYCAGAAVNWSKSLGLFNNYTDINDFAKQSAIAQNLVFVPALAGLGSPHWDDNATGLWLGMNLNTTAKDLVQAVIEGVAFRAGELINLLMKETNATISIDGGMAINPYFCQFLTDVIQAEIKVPDILELTSYGACMMILTALNTDGKAPQLKTKTYVPAQDLSIKQNVFAEAIIRAGAWKNV